MFRKPQKSAQRIQFHPVGCKLRSALRLVLAMLNVHTHVWLPQAICIVPVCWPAWLDCCIRRVLVFAVFICFSYLTCIALNVLTYTSTSFVAGATSFPGFPDSVSAHQHWTPGRMQTIWVCFFLAICFCVPIYTYENLCPD